MRFLYKNL